METTFELFFPRNTKYWEVQEQLAQRRFLGRWHQYFINTESGTMLDGQWCWAVRFYLEF